MGLGRQWETVAPLGEGAAGRGVEAGGFVSDASRYAVETIGGPRHSFDLFLWVIVVSMETVTVFPKHADWFWRRENGPSQAWHPNESSCTKTG